MKLIEGYEPPRDLRRLFAGYFSCKSCSSPSNAQLASAGETIPPCGFHPSFRGGRVFPCNRISTIVGEWRGPSGRVPEANHGKFDRNSFGYPPPESTACSVH